jgi:hypothetical protein
MFSCEDFTKLSLELYNQPVSVLIKEDNETRNKFDANEIRGRVTGRNWGIDNKVVSLDFSLEQGPTINIPCEHILTIKLVQ